MLFLTYEDLHEDLPAAVRLIACFTGLAAGDAEAQALAVRQSSIDFMRQHPTKRVAPPACAPLRSLARGRCLHPRLEPAAAAAAVTCTRSTARLPRLSTTCYRFDEHMLKRGINLRSGRPADSGLEGPTTSGSKVGGGGGAACRAPRVRACLALDRRTAWQQTVAFCPRAFPITSPTRCGWASWEPTDRSWGRLRWRPSKPRWGGRRLLVGPAGTHDVRGCPCRPGRVGARPWRAAVPGPNRCRLQSNLPACLQWTEVMQPVCGCATYDEMRRQLNQELGRPFCRQPAAAAALEHAPSCPGS